MDLIIDQRQKLNLRMTSELRQAITLLQYSTYELYQYIKDQEMENPLINLKEQENDPLYVGKPNSQLSSNSPSRMTSDLLTSNDRGMRIKLYEQAVLLFKDSQDQKLIRYLIDNLDDNGYLNVNEHEPFLYDEYAENDIDRGIQLLQHVGPLGIGARSLKECLLLQIPNDFPKVELAEYLIQNHLDLLANRKWDQIATHLKMPLDTVKEIHDFILTLNPRPCSQISDFSIEYVNPDIIVERKETGLSFYLNDSYLPSIHFNNEYSSFLKNKDEMSKYITTQYNNYQWLISSIEQRRQTILKIVKVIIEKQENFFKAGFTALNPLTLKEVSKEIGMHESTVSRATMNKIIQTPKGTFDLRVFFPSKLDTVDGNSISQTKVKRLLETFIAQENKLKPLSDQKIASYFKNEKGITISRRTISKYREELKIPSSSRRKEIDNMMS
ncbi:RNA polymerase factor sigma-54 [Lysinibacillus contaminans]|uniref:RNA polymerase factor sigma-54 n=1 Tax=Lysinibacillus contaminans TaxID=1293441 RepID=A0ABR5JVT3_9BACI|nr:RNA polymerase factor sigma-54 [Lysinibacillus contaminans]KOS66262.1 RNA polymerase factor sigma-54 [Lysinibacillus contaminans]